MFFLTTRARDLWIALCASDFRDAGGRDTGAAIGVRGRLEGDFRSLELMLDSSIDMDANDIESSYLIKQTGV